MGKQKQSNTSKSNSAASSASATPVPASKPTPARRKATVLKSGNAGSSKAAEEAKIAAQANPTPTAALFGSNWTGKTPLSLLHEHCQKRGWDKPVIDARKNAGGETFSGIVILKKKDDSVLLKPQDEVAIACSTALEARHKAAVYALYRFANNLNLKMTLPPIMREYWGQLEKFKSASPKDKVWLWAADPFQAKAQHQQAVANHSNASGSGGSSGSNTHAKQAKSAALGDNIPEFRLGRALQEQADSLLRKRMARSQPNSGAATPMSLSITEDELSSISRYLQNLGFAPVHIQSALTWLNTAASSSSDRFVQELLASKSLKDAAVTYLQLTLAHAQLPPVFQRAAQQNEVKVSKATDAKGLAESWKAQKLRDQTGFPLEAIEKRLERAQGNLGLATDCLLRDLAGLDSDPVWSSSSLLESARQPPLDSEESNQRWQEEVEVLESIYADRMKRSHSKDGEHLIILSAEKNTLALSILRHPTSRYPSVSETPSIPTAVVVGDTVAPYIRLALSRKLFDRLMQADAVDIARDGQGGLLCRSNL